MKRLISTKNLSKSEWLLYRKKGITGTDAGAITGMNPYKSAFAVYQDKISYVTDDVDNESMRQGRDFDNSIAKIYKSISMSKNRTDSDSSSYIMKDGSTHNQKARNIVLTPEALQAFKDLKAYLGDLESTTRKYYIAIRKKLEDASGNKSVINLPIKI